MTSEPEDSDQLELWPTDTAEAEVARHESRSPSGRTRPALTRQRPAPSRMKPVDTSDPRPTAIPAIAKNDGERLWSIAEVAHYLGVSTDTIYGWRKTGYGPPASKIGKHLRWRTDDVREWVDRLRQTKPSATE